MDNEMLIADKTYEQKCADCKKYEENIDEMGIIIMILAFIGPIIGMLIGIRAAKKLIER